MAKVDSISFGPIVIVGKKYRRDVLLFPDGSVKQRKGSLRIFGILALSAWMLRAASGAQLWDGLTTRPQGSYIIGTRGDEG